MKIGDNLRSSQQSPDYGDYSNKKKMLNSLESSMFIDDFCAYFSFTFKNSNNDMKFYYINAPDKKLESLLENNYLYFEFDKILFSNFYDLILYGKAYVEKILCYDDEGKLVKIAFKPLRYKKQIYFANKLYYRLQKYNGEIEKGKVDGSNLIVFDIKDLGYSKYFFKRKIRKLSNLKEPDINLIMDKNSGFDFTIYNDKNKYKLLKIMKGTYWNGRDSSNKYVSEPYFLYRLIKFYIIRSKFLAYLVRGYNNELKELGKKYGFSGEIAYDSKVDDFESVLNEFKTGKMKCKEIIKIIFQ